MWTLYNIETRTIQVDACNEGNNENGTPMLFSRKDIAEEAIENYGVESQCIPVRCKLVITKPKRRK